MLPSGGRSVRAGANACLGVDGTTVRACFGVEGTGCEGDELPFQFHDDDELLFQLGFHDELIWLHAARLHDHGIQRELPLHDPPPLDTEFQPVLLGGGADQLPGAGVSSG